MILDATCYEVDRNMMQLGMMEHTCGNLAHQRLGIALAFACEDEVSIGHERIEMQLADYELDAWLQGGTKVMTQGKPKATGCPIAWLTGRRSAWCVIGRCQWRIACSGKGKDVLQATVKTHDGLGRSTLLWRKDVGSTLRTEEGIANIARYMDGNTREQR